MLLKSKNARRPALPQLAVWRRLLLIQLRPSEASRPAAGRAAPLTCLRPASDLPPACLRPASHLNVLSCPAAGAGPRYPRRVQWLESVCTSNAVVVLPAFDTAAQDGAGVEVAQRLAGGAPPSTPSPRHGSKRHDNSHDQARRAMLWGLHDCRCMCIHRYWQSARSALLLSTINLWCSGQPAAAPSTVLWIDMARGCGHAQGTRPSSAARTTAGWSTTLMRSSTLAATRQPTTRSFLTARSRITRLALSKTTRLGARMPP